jgi:hypothetical protein
MTDTPRRTWPHEVPLLDRDFQAPIRMNALDAPMATRRAPRRALIWWTVATVCSIAAAVTLLAGAL